ncbi:MAG: hypothetical protein ABJC61_01700 [Acidobacteriota bacterium]
MSSCSRIRLDPPSPIATVQMTAAIPMVIPEHRQRGAHLVARERGEGDDALVTGAVSPGSAAPGRAPVPGRPPAARR